MPLHNPFSPSITGLPDLFFGRKRELELFRSALANARSPYRLLFVTGNKGYGKTSLLGRFAELAAQEKWEVVPVHSMGAVSKIAAALESGATQTVKTLSPTVSVAPVTVSLRELSLSHGGGEGDARHLSILLQKRFGTLKRRNGIFIAVDEVQSIDEDEIREICIAAKDARQAGFPIMLVLAGLPYSDAFVCSCRGCTFMKRAEIMKLSNLKISETREAFRTLMGAAGDAEMENGVVERLCNLSMGQPYLVQLLGYNLIERTNALYPVGRARITLETVESITTETLITYEDRILGTAFASLSNGDLEYAQAVAQLRGDDGKAPTGKIAALLGKDAAGASPWRKRLVDKQIIKSAGHGFVRFCIPYTAEFIQVRMLFDDESEDDLDEWQV